jgi:hypothetical protein
MLLAFPDKEAEVPIVAVFEAAGFTQEAYEETVRRLTEGGGQLASPSDWPVEGLLAHAAGQGPNGFRVVDVWESADAFQRFGETLLPMLEDLGIEGEPEVYPAHTFVAA